MLLLDIVYRQYYRLIFFYANIYLSYPYCSELVILQNLRYIWVADIWQTALKQDELLHLLAILGLGRPASIQRGS